MALSSPILAAMRLDARAVERKRELEAVRLIRARGAPETLEEARRNERGEA